MQYEERILEGKPLPKPLPKKEIIECFQKFHEGDIDAKNKIIEHNLRLVVKILTQYKTPYEQKELFSVGVIGLIKSVNTFNIDKGIEFATYAARVINNEILMYFRRNNKHLQVASLEDPLGTDSEGNELRIEDTLFDENAEFEDRVINNRFTAKTRKVLKEVLNERELTIICYRYGFKENQKNQAQLAEILGISRSYVSRIEAKALKKLRANFEEAFSETEEYHKNTKENTVFDIHEINEEINFETFVNLLKLFPTWEIKLYTKFRNIDLDRQKINPVKTIRGGGSYPSKLINYVKIIENDLRKMYEYYNLWRKRGINKLDAYEKTKKYMFKHSIRFRYPDYSLKKIKEAVKTLSAKQQEILYLRYGKNLLSFNEFPNDEKKYSQALCIAHKKLEETLEKKSFEIHPESLRAKLSNYSYEELEGFIKKIPVKYQNILYLRYGKELNKYHPFPKDKPYQNYYNLHKKAWSALMDTINGIKVVEEEPRTIINSYKKEDLLYAIAKLSEPDQTAIYLRHGRDLTQNILWAKISAPAGKHENYYQQKYYNCYSKIDEILQEREDKKRVFLNAFMEKIGNYAYEEVLKAILFLPKEEQEVIILKHGKDLTAFHPWPYNKPYNFYIKLYQNAIHDLKHILKNEKFSIKLQEQKTDSEKEQLSEEKINLLKAKLYEEVYQKYRAIIDSNILEAIINRIVNSENYQENIEEYQTQIENEILLYLLNIYKENPDTFQNRLLLDRIKMLFRKKIKKQYRDNSSKKIDLAIEEAFISYTGERSFEEELALKIKKMKDEVKK